MAEFQHPAAGIKSDRDRDKGKSRLPDIRGSAVLKALVIDEGAHRQKYIEIADVRSLVFKRMIYYISAKNALKLPMCSMLRRR